ncbi:hypothetical protein VitviT2T_017131 [Vitis vinifera]|uniref:UBN2 domain-containing protein n=1 Tax=Vitis vinifera TaxID=29760 RepID=A0ABY9CVU5_VITVI|nr:hypothetical protein VitviT2T_017131 [Vitis vinifera]
MITKFTNIVNSLEALGKTYKELEKVMKILRSLPSKWDAKVIAIQEAKHLTKLPLEELIGSLMTYDINLAKKQQEVEDKKKNSIALKVTTKEEEEVEEEKEGEEDEDLSLITRKFNKLMRGEKFRGRSSGSQKSNASNGVQFRVEMKELQPLEANHSKLKEEFCTAAKSPFCCEMISQPFCTVLWNSS